MRARGRAAAAAGGTAASPASAGSQSADSAAPRSTPIGAQSRAPAAGALNQPERSASPASPGTGGAQAFARSAQPFARSPQQARAAAVAASLPPGRRGGASANQSNQPASDPPADAGSPGHGSEVKRASWPRRLLAACRRHERILLLGAGALCAVLLVALHARLEPQQHALTQNDIDAAVLHTLQTKTLPSPSARAYERIRPSVVRVRGLGHEGEPDSESERGTGTGVVILDTGVILTNLHVVHGAKRLKVVFADGSESDASVTGVQAENDLAVLQAKTVPDDLQAATLRSTRDLMVGEQVVAVGFPFGIGPTATAGVVSGLRREFQYPDGKRVLTNLIQFDAAANPGSSGGPLVTNDGEVVGIVTAILNPTEQRVFVGIGFAVPIENAAMAVGMSPF